jgi:hypothetical protein
MRPTAIVIAWLCGALAATAGAQSPLTWQFTGSPEALPRAEISAPSAAGEFPWGARLRADIPDAFLWSDYRGACIEHDLYRPRFSPAPPFSPFGAVLGHWLNGFSCWPGGCSCPCELCPGEPTGPVAPGPQSDGFPHESAGDLPHSAPLLLVPDPVPPRNLIPENPTPPRSLTPEDPAPPQPVLLPPVQTVVPPRLLVNPPAATEISPRLIPPRTPVVELAPEPALPGVTSPPAEPGLPRGTNAPPVPRNRVPRPGQQLPRNVIPR